MDTVAAPRNRSKLAVPGNRPGTPRIRLRAPQRKQALPAPTESLWRVTMAETREVVAERALTWCLMACGLAALGWLAYTTVQFLQAWQGLVTWVRAAMM